MDRRQKKTRQAIYDAFEKLMSQKHYSQVTIAQIIDEADIGRSTFYAHFETKDALLQNMCQELFDHIFEGVNAYCVTHRSLETLDLAGKLAHLLYHLRDSHLGICGKLIYEGEPYFTNYFKKQLTYLIDSEIGIESDNFLSRNSKSNKNLSHTPISLVNAMLVAAFCEAVIWWFDTTNSASPEDVALWYVSLVDTYQ